MVQVTQTSAKGGFVAPPPVEKSLMAPSPVQTDDIIITSSCLQRIQQLAKSRNLGLNQLYLRLYVDAGGCSGFQYKFELVLDEDEAVEENDDVVFDSDGIRLVVDEASLNLLKGATVDFQTDLMKSSFVVMDNPQSESACGCGSSFAVKNFAANPALD
jgi:iron-sulfur cluster assembly accessory protein